MALAAWSTIELVTALPLRGIALELIQVAGGIGLAALTFYLSCRLLGVQEVNDAVHAVAGRFSRRRS